MNENHSKKQTELLEKFNETNRKFRTSTTVNILNDLQPEKNQWQHYELLRKYEQFLPNKINSPLSIHSICSSSRSSNDRIELDSIDDNFSNDICEDLRSLIEQNLPEICVLDGEPMKFTNGCKFYCTVNDILTSDGEFWVDREFSSENERKFRQFIDILSIFATSYESLKDVYVGQLVALFYESSWHRALVVSKSERITISKQLSARVRLVDYGSSLYVNVSQLKWLPEQFYLFPFKAVQCIFSEAIKPTFSDTVRLTFKQLVLRKRLRATVYDKDGTRLCILLKCKTDEGIINVYRYLRAHEHKSEGGRMLDDGDIVQCLHDTIFNNTFDQSLVSNNSTNISMNLTLPILSPPSPIKLTRNQLEIRREEIRKIYKETDDEMKHKNSNLTINDQQKSSTQSTPFSACTIITPMPCLSFPQH